MKTPIYTGIFQSDLDASGYRLIGLPAPSASNDAANKAYVDAHAGGGGGGGTGMLEGWVSVTDYDAVGDAVLLRDAAMTSASAVLTSATAVFTADDVGKSISINGVASSGGILRTTISGFTNATTVTLATTAQTTASSQYCVYGTDNTTAVQAAIAAATSTVFFPPGAYLFIGSIGAVPAGISLVGAAFLGPHWYVPYTSNPLTPTGQELMDTPGSMLMLTDHPGNGSAEKFITVTANTAIIGLTFFWPNQIPTGTAPIAYPWAIYIGGTMGVALTPSNASSVKYCRLMNAYQGIYIENAAHTLIEETRGEAIYRGIKCEGNYSVTRLRGCYFDDTWVNLNGGNFGNIDVYRRANGIAFDLGRNDLTILENCFAYLYANWLHFYDDTAHGFGGTTTPWVQVRGGGADQCGQCIKIEQTAPTQGVDIDGVHLTTPAGGQDFAITSTHIGSVRFHNSMMFSLTGDFGTVAGSGEVTIEDCYFVGGFAGGTTPTVFATTGIAVTGTGNFAMRGCTFKTTQTHVSLGASLVRAVITGNMCSDTFVVSNSMAAGSAVIDGNTGQGTVYVGSDMRLVAVSGGAKLEARNTGTGVWVEAARWTNP